MRFSTLSAWLDWQQTLHPSAIDLGLERIAAVLGRLALDPPPYPAITVGGTNGKGSTVAFLEALFRAAGRKVGCFISPHLLRYPERVRIAGEEVSEAALCRAFQRIDEARGEISLTYFEFGALAALLLFAEAEVELAVLEVGLGGRLDAVNAVAPAVAVVTSVGLDHQKWLGADREAIGFEKAGIFRPGRPAVCGDPEPPLRLLDHAARLGTPLHRVGVEYGYAATPTGWRWWGPGGALDELPLPALAGPFQLGNAATAIAAAYLLEPGLDRAAIERGLAEAFIAGRFQRLAAAEGVERIVDVAHNPHGAAALAGALAAAPAAGRTLAVLAMLEDKDAAGVVAALAPQVAQWFPAGLGVPRGVSAAALAVRSGLAAAAGHHATAAAGHATVAAACDAALAAARPGDRVVVLGSFHTVAEALEHWCPAGPPEGAAGRVAAGGRL